MSVLSPLNQAERVWPYDEEAKKIGNYKTCEDRESDEAIQPERKKQKNYDEENAHATR